MVCFNRWCQLFVWVALLALVSAAFTKDIVIDEDCKLSEGFGVPYSVYFIAVKLTKLLVQLQVVTAKLHFVKLLCNIH